MDNYCSLGDLFIILLRNNFPFPMKQNLLSASSQIILLTGELCHAIITFRFLPGSHTEVCQSRKQTRSFPET